MPPGANFPVGWKFVIDPTMEGYKSFWAPMKGAEGLKILSPTEACFYSVERAKAYFSSKRKDICERSFYAHIGALATDGSRLASGSSASRSDASHEDTRPQEICRECENCTKDPCGRCSRCKSHHLGRSRDCFQKVRCIRVMLLMPLIKKWSCSFVLFIHGTNRCASEFHSMQRLKERRAYQADGVFISPRTAPPLADINRFLAFIYFHQAAGAFAR
jgi:hypothetical protein